MGFGILYLADVENDQSISSIECCRLFDAALFQFCDIIFRDMHACRRATCMQREHISYKTT